MSRDTKELVALVLAGTIASFVLGSLIVVFVLALRGHALPDVWGALFALMTALLSALGGWLAGSRSTSSKL